jgi:hypothetical protein
MEDEMHKTFVGLLIAVLLMPTGGFAQTRSPNEGREGSIRLPAILRPTGVIREAASRELRLAVQSSASAQQQPEQRSWPGRHPVLFGALVGLGVGLGVEAAVIPGASGGEPHSVYLPMFGGVGAGTGALAGWIVSAARR